jgi:putative FmdB family regulatory protein
MPLWDFYCELCDLKVELSFRTLEDADHATCPKCGSLLSRKPAAPNFSVKGYNADNGYSK